MVIRTMAGLLVRAQSAVGSVSGTVCPLGEDSRVHSSRHFCAGAVCLGGIMYIVLLLQHGEGQPQPPPPVVRLSSGSALSPKQQRSTGRREGAGSELHAAGQYSSEDAVGTAGETAGMCQVFLFNYSMYYSSHLILLHLSFHTHNPQILHYI